MKVYLLDRNETICNWWRVYFKDTKDVEIVCDDFENFVSKNNVECIVSPANSYGIMDGGYDGAITSYFGKDLARKVQDYIVENFYGEQPVGSSCVVDINESQKLIHTPTMRIPSKIKDAMVVYHCMRSTLILARKIGIKSIVIPAFGGDCGDVKYSVLAEMMYNAYYQISNPPKEIDWGYAYRWAPEDVF